MRALLASDLHASEEAIESIAEHVKMQEPDVLLIAGDLTHFGPQSYVEDLLDEISCKVLAVNGNCDPPAVGKILEDRGASLMDKVVMFDGVAFAGVAWSGSRSLVSVNPKLAPETLRLAAGFPLVVVSHSPAMGHLDSPSEGVSLGSKAVKDFIAEIKPRVVASGHIHEARGSEKKAGVLYVNAGPAMYGHAALIEISDGEAEVELL